jgi:hypothetical protein
MDVPGLPKSNLMRTNSSAYATLDTFGSRCVESWRMTQWRRMSAPYVGDA